MRHKLAYYSIALCWRATRAKTALGGASMQASTLCRRAVALREDFALEVLSYQCQNSNVGYTCSTHHGTPNLVIVAYCQNPKVWHTLNTEYRLPLSNGIYYDTLKRRPLWFRQSRRSLCENLHNFRTDDHARLKFLLPALQQMK